MCAERQISQRFREVCPCAEVDTAQEAFLQRERTKEYKRAFDRGNSLSLLFSAHINGGGKSRSVMRFFTNSAKTPLYLHSISARHLVT